MPRIPLQDEILNVVDFRTLEMDAPEDERWELIDGRLHRMMAGGTFAHNAIIQNIAQTMTAAFRKRRSGCRPYTENIRLEPSDQDTSTLPDVVAICQPHPLSSSTIRNPVVVVEVLSKGTRSKDLSAKRRAYRRIASLRHIVFVEQEAMSVEADHRGGEEWRTETLVAPSDALALAAIEFEMALSAVYEDVFPEAASA